MPPALGASSTAMRSTGPAVMAATAELVDALVPLKRIGTHLNVRRNEDVYAKRAAPVRRRKTFDSRGCRRPARGCAFLRKLHSPPVRDGSGLTLTDETGGS